MEPEKEDILAPRFSEPLKEGRSKDHYIDNQDFKNELNEYYKIRGWVRGVPSQKTIKRLGLISLWNSVNK